MSDQPKMKSARAYAGWHPKHGVSPYPISAEELRIVEWYEKHYPGFDKSDWRIIAVDIVPVKP